MTENSMHRIHFIGVGGVGMSGIALVAHERGFAVSGSDLRESRYTKELSDAGVTVFIGQKAENISADDLPDVVVVSSAIPRRTPSWYAPGSLASPSGTARGCSPTWAGA